MKLQKVKLLLRGTTIQKTKNVFVYSTDVYCMYHFGFWDYSHETKERSYCTHGASIQTDNKQDVDTSKKISMIDSEKC